jgi:hypothetical protein
MAQTLRLSAQVLIRMEPKLRDALQADAEANGRTITQTIRYLLARSPTIAERLDTPGPTSV